MPLVFTGIYGIYGKYGGKYGTGPLVFFVG